jgi:hypothetical protein
MNLFGLTTSLVLENHMFIRFFIYVKFLLNVIIKAHGNKNKDFEKIIESN